MITNETFLSFLHCPRKAHLKTTGSPGEPTDIERVQLALEGLYGEQVLKEFLRSAPACEVIRNPLSLAATLRERPRWIVNGTATVENVCCEIHLLERVEGAERRGAAAYTPVRFIRNNKISRLDKLLLAFNAFALTSVQGVQPFAGKIVHGDDRKALRVKVEPLMHDVRQLVDRISAVQRAGRAPPVTLNRHCNICEFRNACRKVAEEADDLSLLRVLHGKEVEKLRARGIATVTQFSHTYRPGRRGKWKTGKARKHDPALQALAIREKKVYVLDSPQLPRSGVAVYLDVEGIPDLDFYYLIGLVAVQDRACTAYSFWADDVSQQKAVWDTCARVIENLGDYTLYHYGSYEQRFLDCMAAAGDEAAAAVERIRAKSCNVLAAIQSHVYFPTYSNGLKDIAAFLNVRWSHPNASGIQALAWRLDWEKARDDALKQQLLHYNKEDCLALRRVTDFICSLCGGEIAGQGRAPAVANVLDIPQGGFRFGKTRFFCPELDHINRCSYSDYQREKVYFRSSPLVRKSILRKQRTSKRRPKVDKAVECGRPKVCPECGGTRVYIWAHRFKQKVIPDLKFTRSGIKRWTVKYISLRYRCWDCKRTFFADAYRTACPRWGNNLSNWVIYQHLALRQSYHDVSLTLNDLFALRISDAFVTRITFWAADRYKDTYSRMKDKLRRGPLIHADETKVTVRDNTGYVWAFTNLDEAIYVFTPTREGNVLEDMLDGFTGVLISDFYTAYDSANCLQQKCLIHLVRDVNNDLFHCPFDEELKQLAQRLVAVLKPIIETIDKFGLKVYHLKRHKKEVARYFHYLGRQTYESEMARKYQKRILKYKHKLFVFLDHDGVPWNNNNAEHAIKEFASRRRIIGGASTERGLRNYLIFLSIYHTCRLRQLSFLRFLRSGTFDIDTFADSCRG